MDGGSVVLSGGEVVRVEGVGVGPEGIVSGAVGVAVAEDDGAGAVGAEGGGAVHEHGFDGPAADVGDGRCGRCRHIHEAGHGGTAVGGHVGDGVGHHDMEGVAPRMGVSGAVGVGVGVQDVALASVEAGAVNSGLSRCEGAVAGVGDGRQGDAVGGDLRHAADGGLAAGGGDGEVLGDDMVGVCPGVVVAVDRVVEGIDGVAAAAVGYEGGAFKIEADHLFADLYGRCGGREDIAGAVYGGVGVGYGGEVAGRDGIDELPRVGVSGAVGVGVAVGHGAVSVGGDVHGRVGGVRRGGNLASAGVGERVGRGRDSLVGTGDDAGTGLRDGQCRQLDDVGVDPVVRMAGAVGEGVGVDDVVLASVESGVVHGGLRCGEWVAAGVGHCRDVCGRGDGHVWTADGLGAVLLGDGEVLGRHMVGVLPGVVVAVDGVVIDERGVAAAVGECGGVGAGLKRDRRAAVGDVGQGGGHNLGEAVDRSLAVSIWCECAGNHVPGISPNGIVSGAVGVGETVDDRARAVLDVDDGIKDSRGNVVAADILDGRWCHAGRIGDTGHGVGPVCGHISDGGG